MKVFHIKWSDFLNALDTWDQISRNARQVFLDHSQPAGKLVDSTHFGTHLAELKEAGLLLESADGTRVKLSKSYPVFRRVICTLNDIPLFEMPNEVFLLKYMDWHYTLDERACLFVDSNFREIPNRVICELVTTKDHLDGFIQSDNYQLWEQRRKKYSENPFLFNKKIAKTLQTLIRRLREKGEPIRFKDIKKVTGINDTDSLSSALRAGFRYILFFASLDPATLDPIVGIWPGIIERERRPKPIPPPTVQPAESFHLPFMMEDMTVAFGECSLEPFRVRGNDRAIFAKTYKTLSDCIVSLPDFVDEKLEIPAEGRIEHAIHCLHRLEMLMVRGRAGKDLRLEITPKGQKWFETSPKKRLQFIVNAMKRTIQNTKIVYDPNALIIDFIPSTNYYYYYSEYETVVDKVLQIFSELKSGKFVRFRDFLNYYKEVTNPFLSTDDSNRIPTRRNHFYRNFTEEEAEKSWASILDTIVSKRLLPLGGARLGVLDDGSFAFSLTDIGCYLLGLKKDFDYSPSESGELIVQPNFDIAFLEPSPQAEVSIGRFAERTGKKVGCLFHITQSSIIKAAASGTSLEEIVQSLRSLSSKPLPRNVEHEIREWYAQLRRVEIQDAVIVRCPDIETTAKVRAAGGKKIQLLTDTILMLTDRKQKKALIRKLRDKGVFIE